MTIIENRGCAFTAFAVLAALLWAPPARADMGPCKPDSIGSLVCGDGDGAARVVDDSTSPDGTLAFAWRNPEGPPTEQPDSDDKLELVMVRLADGAVLAKSPTEYWSTGTIRANRLVEQIAWSPDGRLAVRTFEDRVGTARFELFSPEAAPFDLKPLAEPAVRRKVKPGKHDLEDWTFTIVGSKLKLGNDGAMRFPVVMWVPKTESVAWFNVAMRVSHSRNGFSARIVSVAKGKGPK